MSPRNRRKRSPHRTHVRRRDHHHAAPPAGPEDQALIRGIRQALRGADPVEFLMLVSAVVEVSDTRHAGPMAPDSGEAAAARATLVESMAAYPIAETTAVLTALRCLLPAGDPNRPAVDEALEARRHPLPLWLSGLGEAHVSAPAWRMTHDLGDGDNHLVEVTVPGSGPFTLVAYVDHNMGTVLKDAFLVPDSIDVVLDFSREHAEPGHTFAVHDAADTRAAVEAALEQGARTLGMPEGDTWPMMRPCVEWLITLLPEGGEVRPEEEWSEADADRLLDEFLASPHAAGLGDPSLASLLVDFGVGYNVGGPLRWSPVTVEIVLASWFPNKVLAPYGEVAELPDVLRAFVRFAHGRQSIDAGLTAQTLAAVDDFADVFETEMTEGEHPLAGLIDPAAFYQDTVASAVGGPEALERLDDVPLPDEPFDWSEVPDDVHERVAEYLRLLDDVADEHLDVEHRTAMRRFLARAAMTDPAIFRRRASVQRGAAAVAWAVCRANDTVGGHAGAPYQAQELIGWFGQKGSVSQRAQPLLRAIGAPVDEPWTGGGLGTPDLLVSARRRRIIDRRDAGFAV